MAGSLRVKLLKGVYRYLEVLEILRRNIVSGFIHIFEEYRK